MEAEFWAAIAAYSSWALFMLVVKWWL